MKIAFLISTLDAGGAQRVATILCNHWVVAHEVTLLTFQAPDDPLQFPLDERVKYFALDLLDSSKSVLGAISRNIARVTTIRRRLREIAPDIVVCFMTETNVVGTLAARWARVPVVISERIHPAHHPLLLVHRIARLVVYRMANALVVQTQNIADWYQRRTGLVPVRIANPVEFASVPVQPRERAVTTGREIVSIGRLDMQKGFDVLINAFYRVAADRPDWSLTIYGEGPLRTDLEIQVEMLGLHNRVRLPGITRDAREQLRGADLYVHAARYEGFPNAVAEALAEGLCVIATDCPGASAELLQHGRYGILATSEDPESLAQAMARAMDDTALRGRFAGQARDALQGFDIDTIAASWLSLFENVVSQSRDGAITGAL